MPNIHWKVRILIRFGQRQAIAATTLQRPLLDILALTDHPFRHRFRHRLPRNPLLLQRPRSYKHRAHLTYTRIHSSHFHCATPNHSRRTFLNILGLRPNLQRRRRNILIPRPRILRPLNPSVFHINHRSIPAR